MKLFWLLWIGQVAAFALVLNSQPVNVVQAAAMGTIILGQAIIVIFSPQRKHEH